MAEQQKVNLIAKGLGARIAAAHEAHKDKPFDAGGFSQLPGGINNGVAQLTGMVKGEKDGKPFFRATGVVIEPAEHAGKQTSQFVPLYDTPDRQNKKRFEDHWEDYEAIFKGFGVDMPPLRLQGESPEAAGARIDRVFDTAAAHLVNVVKPYFSFRTWQGKKQTTGQYANQEPRVNEYWQGQIEYHAAPNPAANGQVVDTTMTAAPFVEPPQHQPTAAPAAPPVQPPAAPAVATAAPVLPPPPPAAPTQLAPASSQVDLSALAEMADMDQTGETDEGKYAITYLTELANSLGITDEQLAAVTSWQQVLSMINAVQQGASAAPVVQAAGGARPAPVKGATVIYGGQPCEVTSVNAEARTVTLKGPDKKAVVDENKKLAKISFDLLS
jgi:hypothetical protein